LPLHLSDPEIHAPRGQPPRWTVPSVPQEGLRLPTANPFSMPVGGGGDPGGDDPPTPPKIHPVVQFDASSWPDQPYPATEIGPPTGETAPPFTGATAWNPTTNAFELNTTFTGTITAVKVCPPEAGSPAYTVGAHIDTWSEWTGQDVGGQWSGGYLWLQIWNPGAYALEVDFASAAPYQGFVTVAGGGVDGAPSGPPKPYQFPQANACATIISEPANDPYNFCATAALILPAANRAPDCATAVQDLQFAYQGNGNNPITAVLIGHGSLGGKPGQFEIGSDWMGPLIMAGTVEPAFAQGLRGEIRDLTLFSCYTGKDMASGGTSWYPGGYVPLVQQLAQDLHAPGGCSVTVRAFSGNVVCCTQAYAGVAPTFRQSYFAVAANGTWYSYTCSSP
jgi:hypothetical protein